MLIWFHLRLNDMKKFKEFIADIFSEVESINSIHGDILEVRFFSVREDEFEGIIRFNYESYTEDFSVYFTENEEYPSWGYISTEAPLFLRMRHPYYVCFHYLMDNYFLPKLYEKANKAAEERVMNLC